ncbi:hypothetical protein COT72_04775 [archaeon CG10_big_fil_rev_8_21_14_0_10_43_11]|nr:MAG: hypothetical protein COT72_04775 [archaeon CG10_big_fil_rev_8_21_14_0_10_43_11]
MLRVFFLSILVVGTLLFIAGMSQQNEVCTDCNVILISLDSVRTDMVGVYGSLWNATPALDAFSKDALVFENAYSTTSYTLPAHASMLTGLYPLTHGIFHDITQECEGVQCVRDIHDPMMQDLLKKQGYATAGFVSGAYVSEAFGFSKGFDTYQNHLQPEVEHFNTITSQIITQKGIEWMDAHKNRSFFLFLHYFDPHYNYLANKTYPHDVLPSYAGDLQALDGVINRDGEWTINKTISSEDREYVFANYAGDLAYTDAYIKRVIEYLKAEGLYEKTILIITSDHGDEFFEHGSIGHKGTLYAPVHHIPLIVRVPGITARRVRQLVSHVDILPTVLLALNFSNTTPIEGVSLLTPLPERIIYQDYLDKSGVNNSGAHWCDDTQCFTYVHANGSQPELYDITRDPQESQNIYETSLNKVSALEQHLANRRASVNLTAIINLTDDGNGARLAILLDEMGFNPQG